MLSAVAAALLAAPGPAAAAPSSFCLNADAMPLTIPADAFDESVLCLLNRERTKRGLAALRDNPKLSGAAAGHSASMRWGSFFAHDGPRGDTFASRIQATGYTNRARRWLIGENIAWGSYELGTPSSLVEAWMNSPPHRENILEARFRAIGVGVEWGTPQNPKAQSAAIITTDFGFVKRRKR